MTGSRAIVTAPAWRFPLEWPARLGRTSLLASVGAVCAAIFVVLALIVNSGWESSYRIDARVAVRANDAVEAHETYEHIVSTITGVGDSVVVATITGFVFLGLLFARRWRSALLLFLTVGVGMVLTTVMKYLVERPRPPSEYGLGEDSPSFPSGHTAGTTLLWLTLLLLVLPWEPRTRWPVITAVCVSLPVVIASSRVLLAAHYVSDVLASLFLSVAVVALATLLAQPWKDIEALRRRYGLGQEAPDDPVESESGP